MHNVGLTARAYCNTAAAMSGGGWTKVPLATVDAPDDIGAYYNLANNRYICPGAGSFRCDWTATPVASASAQYAVTALYLTGNPDTLGSLAYSPASLALLSSTGSVVVSCEDTDYLELWCFVNTNLSLNPGKVYNTLSVQQVA